MALPAPTTWEIRTTGSDTLCSGGFVAGASGTDYSQQNAAQYNATDLVIDATTNTKVTSVAHSFAAADVGNILRITTAGTGLTVGFYQIVSVASGAATLDRSAGTLGSTGGTYYVGGAFASPGQAGAAHVAGNIVHVKSGTYLITSITSNVAGGRATSVAGVGGTTRTKWIGYQNTRFDYTGVRPLLQASGIASVTLATGASTTLWDNIDLDGNSLTGMTGSDSFSQIIRVTVSNCLSFGIGASAVIAVNCRAVNCATGIKAATAFACVATGCSVSGIRSTSFNCISYSNSGSGFDTSSCTGCASYGNTGNGFNWFGPGLVANCIAANNGGYGFCSGVSTNDLSAFLNCAAYSNTSGDYSGVLTNNQFGCVTLTAAPFTNAAGSDFSLNNNAGGGAACRAAGFPGTFPGVTTTGYIDIGAVQHRDPPLPASLVMTPTSSY